jgi:hypothetical protein
MITVHKCELVINGEVRVVKVLKEKYFTKVSTVTLDDKQVGTVERTGRRYTCTHTESGRTFGGNILLDVVVTMINDRYRS